jgi:hypothetical protein
MRRSPRRPRDQSAVPAISYWDPAAAAMRSVSAVAGVEKSSSLLHLCNQKHEPPIYDKTMKSFRWEGNSMCDFAYINFLREKVRQLEVEEKRLRAFGPTPSARFVPWTMPAQSPKSDRAPDRLG